jgi:hypothetical protein
MPMWMIWFFGMLVVAIYCICQAVRDFRRGERAMGLVGVVCAAFILLMPVQNQPVSITLPIANSR